ncbi:MarR family winged helix-turn-helix transcriptional regulator [Mucilaginibacter gotjawali]|uniref:HTH-type transcriptional repressor NicR n=2 Tax=Mucilaginibacter gotjawali TaxID=1550579 RepID=A0A0X8X0U9_9SPHI|nr:MarR family winged helix-turn-helix transcriptional regulator [Mucilaginibacter gotjawali]MBB3058428.1 DNA-binding MarR family transcriptional regulator [Mucilaginibacter gotjawali]BAU53744.1 HTH-type transcriptional repressor NicR [Mucilaginibacter gotjawali]
MKSYQLIHQLIDLVAQLEEENQGQEVSIQDFTGFLLNKVGDPSGDLVNSEVRFGSNDTAALEIAYQLDNNIGRLFVFMSRYAKYYIKKALEGTSLQTGEDFTALAILLTHNHLSKSELISHNLQEKTSGTEVIRRLIAAGLVRQWDDVKDKRSKHIAITNEGRELLYRVFVDMNRVSKMITGKLSIAEKFTLQYLLQKLENFHLEHYEKKTITTKADLISFMGDNSAGK